MLGFGAGVMMAASCFSLILPGVAAGSDIFSSRPAGAALVDHRPGARRAVPAAGDKAIPHEHVQSGRHGPDWKQLRRVWLMVFAIALHNFPEGMAIGVGFSGGDPSVGIPLAVAIAIQDIPEGLVVAVALRTVAYAPWQATLAAALTGLAEPLGAIVGVALTSGFAPLYPAGLGFVFRPPSGRASMANDLLRGGRLELEWLSGAVVRRGELAGVPTPVHRTLYAALAPYANGAPEGAAS